MLLGQWIVALSCRLQVAEKHFSGESDLDFVIKRLLFYSSLKVD